MNKFVQKRALSEETPLAEVINREPERRDFKTAKLALADQREIQRNTLFDKGPKHIADDIPVAVAATSSVMPLLSHPSLDMPSPQFTSPHDHLIAYIQSKQWQFWGHVNPEQPDLSKQSWTQFPTSKEVQVLKGNTFLIRQSGPNARNAPGSKVVHWVCQFQHAQNATNCFVPIKMCPFEKKLFSTEITHAEAIAANNSRLMPMILVVRADLLAENFTIRQILGSYVSSKQVPALMPIVWIMKNNQIHEYTFQSAQQYLSSAHSIKSQLGAKALSPASANKVRKRELESLSSSNPSSGDSSTPELKRSETDEEATLSKSVSLVIEPKQSKVDPQPAPPQKKSSQKTLNDPKQKSLTNFFGRFSQGAPLSSVLPKENDDKQPDHLSPDI